MGGACGCFLTDLWVHSRHNAQFICFNPSVSRDAQVLHSRLIWFALLKGSGQGGWEDGLRFKTRYPEVTFFEAFRLISSSRRLQLTCLHCASFSPSLYCIHQLTRHAFSVPAVRCAALLATFSPAAVALCGATCRSSTSSLHDHECHIGLSSNSLFCVSCHPSLFWSHRFIPLSNSLQLSA